MNLWQSIFLGITQGLTEFLPISSSGHLVLFPYLFNFPDPGLAFDVALHLGTLLAILTYFWKDWVEIFQKTFFSSFFQKKDSSAYDYPPHFFWIIIFATIPGALIGLIFNDLAENFFRNPYLIAGNLFFFGWLLYLVDNKKKNNVSKISSLNFNNSFLIGLSQAIAILPGVSRSGITITSGLSLGLDRKNAARFSFLLSAPIIFGATFFKFQSFFASSPGLVEIIGIFSSAISGFLAISFLLKFVEKNNYKIFFWYRLTLAIIIIIISLSF